MNVDIVGFLVSWLTLYGVYAILSVSLNLEIGFTGISNFGKVAFYGIGAYLNALITVMVILAINGVNAPITSLEAITALSKYGSANPALNMFLFALVLVLAFLVAGSVGYLITYPTLRVGPAFVGITLVSFGEMLRVFLRNYNPAGGTYGIAGIPNPFSWISDPMTKQIVFLSLVMGLLALTYLFTEKLTNSPFGRVMKSVREDEIAALCLGKNVPKFKAKVLFIGSGLAGIAGVLLVSYIGFATPDMLITTVTFDVWGMVILGGMGNIKGSLLGSLIITLIDRLSFLLNVFFPSLIIDPNFLRWMILGLIIILVLMFRPRGLIPEKPIKTVALDMMSEEEAKK